MDRDQEARTPLREYANAWIERFQGSGRGFTSDTRREYERDLTRYSLPILGDLRLGSVTPRHIAEWVGWLCDPGEQGRRVALEKRARKAARLKVLPSSLPLAIEPVHLADATVRRIAAPLRSLFASAVREGAIRANPCNQMILPYRPRIEEADAEKAKAMTRTELATFFRIVPSKWRLLFEVLAATGIRWGELAALRWCDLRLDGSEPMLRVRRALARPIAGQGPRFKVPKSKYGKRDIPLDATLARALRERRRESMFSADEDLVFPARGGSPIRQENLRRRVLRVAAGEAGVPWIGFHTLRHTFASMCIEAGRNPRQLQALLGHHSVSFTMATYVHLMDGGVGGALDLGAELAGAEGGSKVGPSGTEIDVIAPEAQSAETVS